MADDTIHINFINPCGVGTIAFADGAITCRVATGYIEDPKCGLLAEMKAGGERVPWRSEAVRDEAIASIQGRSFMGEAVRQALVSWIEGTPFYL